MQHHNNLFLPENSAIREDDTGPSQENIVRLPDAIETIENVCDVTADESKCRLVQLVVRECVYIVLEWK